MKTKLKKITSSKGRLCSDKKRCCIHKCCNAQDDEGCCQTCEPLMEKVNWNHDKGFHLYDE